DIQVGLVAPAEIVADADSEQWDALVIASIGQRLVRSHCLSSSELLMIEARGGDEVEVPEPEYVLGEDSRVAGLPLIIVYVVARFVVAINQRVGSRILVVGAA